MTTVEFHPLRVAAVEPLTDDAVAVTEAVNGGRHGLEERLRLLGLAKAALGGPDVHA